MPNASIIANNEGTDANYIPDFDDKISQERQLTPIHEMDKLNDK